MKNLTREILLILFVLIFTQTGICHIFPKNSYPKVGSAISKRPAKVKIWFDGEVEPAFSKIRVLLNDSTEVDKKNSHVDNNNKALLEVDLKDIQPGKYHVYWTAFSKDGHRSEGDYFFIFESK